MGNENERFIEVEYVVEEDVAQMIERGAAAEGMTESEYVRTVINWYRDNVERGSEDERA